MGATASTAARTQAILACRRPPSRVEDLGDVRELESLDALPAWDHAAAQLAAGVRPHTDPRRRA